MKRKYWYAGFLAILLLISPILLWGCGGGGSAGLSPVASSPSTGSLGVSVNWPQGSQNSNVKLNIPSGTTRFDVYIVSNNSTPANVLSTAVEVFTPYTPYTPSTPASNVLTQGSIIFPQTSTTFNSLNPGNIIVEVFGYNSSNTLTCFGSNSAVLTAGANTNVSVNMSYSLADKQ
ncbi:MAG: hypothetical protein M1536_03300 [Firmicutes bacterium]|nr:hypothetical protein [Bacillota bacterium]